MKDSGKHPFIDYLMSNPPSQTNHDRQAPVIIIGAGRSGSTLLSAMFNAHPSISFFGETFFLAPFLWSRVFERHDLIMSAITAWRNPSAKNREDLTKEEQQRIGKLIAQFVADVTKTDPQLVQWGFKEIWNGSPQFETFDWEIYDHIFPRAKYIHLVRNPVRYAISTAGRTKDVFTREFMTGQLNNWVRMEEYNGRRAATKRYCRLRYEDLIAEPEKEMKRLTSFIGIPWDKKCLNPLKIRHVPSFRNAAEGNTQIWKKPIFIPGLHPYIVALGYEKELEDMGVTILKKKRTRFFWK